MKLKSKLIPTIMLGLAVASLPIAALSSCSNGGNTANVKITVSGVDNVTLEKNETEKNKDLNVKFNTPAGNYEILKVSSVKVGGNALQANQYQFVLDNDAIYHLLIAATYVTGNIDVQLTSTPGVLFKPSISDSDKQYITVVSTRAEKGAVSTFVAQLTQKGITESKQIGLTKVSYTNSSGQEVILEKGTDYESQWDGETHKLTVTLKQGKANNNLTFYVTAASAEKAYTLNKYYDESLLGAPFVSVESLPISLNMDEQLIFDIDPSVFEKKGEEDYKNATWMMGIACQDSEGFRFVNIKDESVTIKVGDKQLTSADFKISDGLIGLDEESDFYYLSWDKKIKITLTLHDERIVSPVSCNPVFIPWPGSTPQVVISLNTFDSELPGLKTSEPAVLARGDEEHNFKINGEAWGEFPRPEGGIDWRFELLDSTGKTPTTNVFESSKVEVWLNDDPLTIDEDYALAEDGSAIYLINNEKKLPYDGVLKISLTLKESKETEPLTCVPVLKLSEHEYNLSHYAEPEHPEYGKIKGLSLQDVESKTFYAKELYTANVDGTNWIGAWPEDGLQWSFCLISAKTGTISKIAKQQLVIKIGDEELIDGEDYKLENGMVIGLKNLNTKEFKATINFIIDSDTKIKTAPAFIQQIGK